MFEESDVHLRIRIRTAVCAGAAAAAAMLLSVAAAASPASPRSPSTEGEKLAVMSDEAYAAAFGPVRARSEGLSVESAAAAAPLPLNRSTASGSHWSVVKFVSKDGEGKYIPTREGNSAFGWQHFSAEHNIHDPKVIKIVTSEHPVKKGVRREYGGVLVNRLGVVLARIKVIAQYDYKTADKVYKLADQSQKIGTITAYCERVARNKCPNAVNET